MFEGVSWGEYIRIIMVAGAVYYIAIWIFFFKARLPKWSALDRLQTSMRPANDYGEIATYIFDEIDPLFSGSYGKAELIVGLKQVLRKYDDIDEPGFRQSINMYIAGKCEKTGSIRLEAEDLGSLW